eukprot:COSAG01_NODE_9472_length_2437_cov_1.368691_1_plen_337_part_00
MTAEARLSESAWARSGRPRFHQRQCKDGTHRRPDHRRVREHTTTLQPPMMQWSHAPSPPVVAKQLNRTKAAGKHAIATVFLGSTRPLIGASQTGVPAWSWAALYQGTVTGPSVLSRALAFARARPVATACIFGSVKAVAADVFVQKVVEGKEQVDLRRTCTFLGFGFLYLGMAQSVIYYRIYPRAFPLVRSFVKLNWRAKLYDVLGQRAVMAQLVTDLCVVMPLLYCPAYYAIEALAQPEPFGALRAALRGTPQRLAQEMPAAIQFWAPLQLFNFAVLPMWCHVPFMASTGLIWLGVLSSWKGARECEEKAAAAAAALLMECDVPRNVYSSDGTPF